MIVLGTRSTNSDWSARRYRWWRCCIVDYLAEGTSVDSQRHCREIRAFVAILKWRNASELLRKGYEFPYEGGDFPVFAAYVAKIGLLPSDIAGDVTEFYGYAAGIFQDFKTLNANRLNDLQKRKPQDSLANNIDGIIPKAETLILKLQKEAARSWME